MDTFYPPLNELRGGIDYAHADYGQIFAPWLRCKRKLSRGRESFYTPPDFPSLRERIDNGDCDE